MLVIVVQKLLKTDINSFAIFNKKLKLMVRERGRKCRTKITSMPFDKRLKVIICKLFNFFISIKISQKKQN